MSRLVFPVFVPALIFVPSAAAATPPVSAAPPTVSGTAREGQTLTASSGSWGGTLPINYAYQWQRCNSAGASCGGIGGATDATHRLVSADVGHSVRVKVTATNSAGTATAYSSQTGVVAKAGSAPAATSQPTPSGAAQVGQQMTANDGTWSGSTPMTFTYQWQRCTKSNGACSNLGGATHKTYSVVSADLDHQLRYLITAHNSAGTGTMNSNLSATVGPAATRPENLEPPVIV